MDKIIILQPEVTEKTSIQLENNVYHFKVVQDTNKTEVKKFIETLYEVKVKNVNILNRKPKQKVRGKIKGKSSGYKKAIVTLHKGEKIEEIKKKY